MVYYYRMHNWSTDEKQLKKDPAAHARWKIEQLVNFGLSGEKVNKKAIKKYWPLLHLDPKKKRFLSFLLWKKHIRLSVEKT